MKVASVGQSRPAKKQKPTTTHGTFNENIELKKYSREEYDSMLTEQRQQLYQLQKKAVLIKGKKTQESSRALEARVAVLETKSENRSNKSSQMKSPKLIIEIIQSLTERGMAPDRAMQTLDGQGYQKGTVSPVS